MAGEAQVARCRSCGAEIVWVKTPRGKAMPCDPPLMTVVTDAGNVARGRVPHWATCPDAARWRRPWQPLQTNVLSWRSVPGATGHTISGQEESQGDA